MENQTEGPEIVRMMVTQAGDPVDVTTSIIVTLLLVVIFISSSIMNALFLVIFFRKSSFRNNSNRLIASLTIINLVSSWVLLPLILVDTLLQLTEPAFLCTTIDALAEFTTSASIFATVMIAVDRFCAVNQPLHYPMLMNRYKCGAMIAVSWILAISIAIASTLNTHASRPWKACQDQTSATTIPVIGSWTYQSYYIVCNIHISFVIPLSSILWMYTQIYKEAEKNSERARRSSLTGVMQDPCTQRDLSDITSTNASVPQSNSVQAVNLIRHRISNASLFLYKEEFRAAKVSVAVFVMFIICWFPYYFVSFLQSDLMQVVIPYDLHSMVLVMSLINTVTSPYMYLYRSRRISHEIHRLLGLSFKFSGGKNQNVYSRNPQQLETIPPSPAIHIENIDPTGNVDSSEEFTFPKPEPPSISALSTFINKIISMKNFIWNNWGEIVNFSLNLSIPVASSTNQNAEATTTFSKEYSLVPS